MISAYIFSGCIIVHWKLAARIKALIEQEIANGNENDNFTN